MKNFAKISHCFQISRETNKNIHIRPLNETDLDECVKIVADSFIKDDKISKLLNVSYDDFSKFTRAGFQRSINEQLAFICKDLSKSKIIGTAVFWDQFKRIKDPINYGSIFTSSSSDKSLQHIVNSMLSQKHLIPTKPNEIIYFSYLNTDKDYSIYKVSREIMKFFIQEHPVGSQASLIYRESINPSNEKLLTKLGWKQFGTLNWQKYVPKDYGNLLKPFEEKFRDLGIAYPKKISLMGYKPENKT